MLALLSNHLIVVMDKQPNGSNMVAELFGEGQCFPYQSAHPLAHRIVEPLNIAGFAALFTHCIHNADQPVSPARKLPNSRCSK